MGLLAIDPGRDTGWAEFTAQGKLYWCGLGDPRCVRPSKAVPKEYVIERPQVYGPRQSKGDPNDLITLAIQVGRYVEWLETCGSCGALVLPRTWKGQTPKPVHARRVWAALDADERVVLASGTVGIYGPRRPALPAAFDRGWLDDRRNNVVDAVGLGLYRFGRLRP